MTDAISVENLQLLRAENAAVREQLAAVMAERDRYRRDIEEYKKLYELVLLELERTRRHLFGQKAERVDAKQVQMVFGIVALEGMAAGKPIVATRVGGLPEVLGNSPGRLVEPTVEGLASGIKAIPKSHDLDSIKRENRILAESFSWGGAAKRYLQIFNPFIANDL